ncbi:hypothetical protein [Aureimonas pseudogalii]|uniref:Uncharacterized protein n=1 Tax=Aureimonas pseudogalii TaxID=1744844 RepID=A0A7W6H4W7_9HYPH|nr:hypothetical protein [Aureimonas pseudogalii]MBB3998621.1 hypothetical protein [Aureimonas pseudogalii]
MFVNEFDRIAVASKFGIVEFGMSPIEMREFANAITEAADRIEAAATAAVDAALLKAKMRRPN